MNDWYVLFLHNLKFVLIELSSGSDESVPEGEWTRGVGCDDAAAESQDGRCHQASGQPAAEAYARADHRHPLTYILRLLAVYVQITSLIESSFLCI